MISKDGPIVFGGCTIGRQGMTDNCERNGDRLPSTEPGESLLADIDIGLKRRQFGSGAAMKEHFCKKEVQDTRVNWPQAVTMFKIKAAKDGDLSVNDEVKAILQKWRTEAHFPNIRWVVQGNSASNIPGASNTRGWGAASTGISRKAIPCDAIPAEFKYPEEKFSMDALDKDGKRGIHAKAFEFWDKTCSAWKYPGATCEFSYEDGEGKAAEKPQLPCNEMEIGLMVKMDDGKMENNANNMANLKKFDGVMEGR
jgi:hypothetical protein